MQNVRNLCIGAVTTKRLVGLVVSLRHGKYSPTEAAPMSR